MSTSISASISVSMSVSMGAQGFDRPRYYTFSPAAVVTDLINVTSSALPMCFLICAWRPARLQVRDGAVFLAMVEGSIDSS